MTHCLAPKTTRLVVRARRGPLAGLVLGLALLCSSCNSGHKPVYPVRGKVLFEGRPTPGAVVFFHPVGEDGPDVLRPTARVAKDGSFEVRTYKSKDGAPAGEYIVTVSWTTKGAQGDDEGDQIIPAKYLSPSTSPLRVKVEPQPNELQPFQLTQN
jgi:hypothetical protein